MNMLLQVYCTVCESSGPWHCAAFACGDGRVRLCRMFYGGSQGVGNGAFVDAFCEGPVLSIASLCLDGETGIDPLCYIVLILNIWR